MAADCFYRGGRYSWIRPLLILRLWAIGRLMDECGAIHFWRVVFYVVWRMKSSMLSFTPCRALLSPCLWPFLFGLKKNTPLPSVIFEKRCCCQLNLVDCCIIGCCTYHTITQVSFTDGGLNSLVRWPPLAATMLSGYGWHAAPLFDWIVSFLHVAWAALAWYLVWLYSYLCWNIVCMR